MILAKNELSSSSESENELTEYFDPTVFEPVEEDHTFSDLGSLGIDSFVWLG